MTDTTAPPKRRAGKEIRGAERSYLERELVRCSKAARNPGARPLTIAWFGRRKELIEAELRAKNRA